MEYAEARRMARTLLIARNRAMEVKAKERGSVPATFIKKSDLCDSCKVKAMTGRLDVSRYK